MLADLLGRAPRWLLLTCLVGLVLVAVAPAGPVSADVLPPPTIPVSPPDVGAPPGAPADPSGLLAANPMTATDEEWDHLSEITKWAICVTVPVAGLTEPGLSRCNPYRGLPRPSAPSTEGNPAGPTPTVVSGGPDLTDYQTVLSETGWSWVGGDEFVSGSPHHLIGTEAWEDTAWTAESGVHRWQTQAVMVWIPDSDGAGTCVVGGTEAHFWWQAALCASSSNEAYTQKLDGTPFGGFGNAATLNVSRPHLVYLSLRAVRNPDGWYGGSSSLSGCIAIDSDGCAATFSLETRNEWSNLREFVDYIAPGLFFGGSGMPTGHIYGLAHSNPGTTVNLGAIWATLVTPPEVTDPHTEEVPATLPPAPSVPDTPAPTVTEVAPPVTATLPPQPGEGSNPQTEVDPSTTTDRALGDRLVDTLRGGFDYIVGGILHLGEIFWAAITWLGSLLAALFAQLLATLFQLLGLLLNFLGAWLSLMFQWMVSLLSSIISWLQAIWLGLVAVLDLLRTLNVWTWLQWFGSFVTAAWSTLSAWLNWLSTLLSGIATAVGEAVASALETALAPFSTAIDTLVELFVPPETWAPPTLDFPSPCYVSCGPTTETPDPGDGPPITPLVPPMPNPTLGTCGPTINIPAPINWTLHAPTPPESGCPGNGPGGSRTAQDDAAGGFFGWRTPVRSLAVVLLWFGLLVTMSRSFPWAGRDDLLGSNLSAMFVDSLPA